MCIRNTRFIKKCISARELTYLYHIKKNHGRMFKYIHIFPSSICHETYIRLNSLRVCRKQGPKISTHHDPFIFKMLHVPSGEPSTNSSSHTCTIYASPNYLIHSINMTKPSHPFLQSLHHLLVHTALLSHYFKTYHTYYF